MINVESGVFTALFAAVSAFGASRTPPAPVAFPAVAFAPPTGAGLFWLEVSLFPNETLPYGWANGGPNEYRGFMQVGVVRRPSGPGGIVPSTNMAAALIAALPKGFTAGDATLTREGWMSSVLIADDRITIPCTFPYRALSARTA